LFQGQFERFINFLERWLPVPIGHLATTAAVEHFTAIFSIWHLENRYLDRCHTSIRDIYQWHGAEELEHKAVAYDLLQDISHISYFWRVVGFFFGIGMVWFGYNKALRMILKWESLSQSQIREERKQARKIRIPLFSMRFPRLFTYLRPGFHPNDLDDRGLSKKILAEQSASSHA
jgi:predicted metal-dependent hydrolase